MDFYGIDESGNNTSIDGEKAAKMSRKVSVYFVLRLVMIFFNIINIALKGIIDSPAAGRVLFCITAVLLILLVTDTFLMSSYSKIFIPAGVIQLLDLGLTFVNMPDGMLFEGINAAITVLSICVFSKAMENSLNEVGSDLGRFWKYLGIAFAGVFIATIAGAGMGYLNMFALAILVLILAIIGILGAGIFYLYLLVRTAKEFRDCAY